MIDSLSPAAMPLPTKNTAASPATGAPSFLQWVMAVSEQAPGGEHSLPDDAGALQHDIADAQLRSPPAVSAAMIDPRLFAATQTLLAQNDSGLQANAMLELHMCNLQGEREVVALPWRLMATGRLAQSIDGHAGAGAPRGALSSTSIASAAATIALSAQPATGGLGVAGTLADTSSTRVALPSSTSMIAAHAAGDVEATATATSAPASSAAVEWLARWIRWIERDGHDPAVWLRDYRIDDDEARRVVDDLRALAREHGISLERIVVNGREHWRNAHTASFKE